MIDIERLDIELYKSAYGEAQAGIFNDVWDKIKNNPSVLREAVKAVKNKTNEKDILKGLTIASAMLIDYKSVDEVAYNSLIKNIYSSTDIARIVMNGAKNGGYSFLLMSLWNNELELTEEQKAFAVNEAMNKFGTTRWEQKEQEHSNTLSHLGDEQAHGLGEYDIRYYILQNPNWSLEEKQKLIMDFWYDDDIYDEWLDLCEWDIANDYTKNSTFLLEKDHLYEYSYESILHFYDDKEKADRTWNEIQFCKQMHELRPQQWELACVSKKM